MEKKPGIYVEWFFLVTREVTSFFHLLIWSICNIIFVLPSWFLYFPVSLCPTPCPTVFLNFFDIQIYSNMLSDQAAEKKAVI